MLFYGFLSNFRCPKVSKGRRKALWCASRRILITPAGLTRRLRRILEALGSVETLKNVSRSWPRQQAALPCAVVTLAGERRADERDGAEYLTETEYYVRCFARTGTEADELALKIRREMEKLGYQREFAWEESSEAVFQRVERYKKWIG